MVSSGDWDLGRTSGDSLFETVRMISDTTCIGKRRLLVRTSISP